MTEATQTNLGLRHPAIRFEVPAMPTASTGCGDGYYRMREWQIRCFNELHDSHHWIINAPMAAGKSFQICAMAAHWLRREATLKVVIAVPQTIIANGFRSARLQLPDGVRIAWDIRAEHDLCAESAKSSTKHLEVFLHEEPNPDPMSRVVLCTHSSLVRSFITNPNSFKSVLVVIDEAHHAKHGSGDGAVLENQMGKLVKYALENPKQIRLGLTTATLFRGDGAAIVPDVSVFDRFDLAFDEFLSTCEHLRSFSYDFLLDSSFGQAVNKLFDERLGKTIIHIPPVNSRFSLGSKEADVQAVIKAIAGTDTPVVDGEGLPVMRIKRADGWIRVVNLVEEKHRAEKKRLIDAAHASTCPDDLDVIIALGMFKEGAHWRYADREIIIGQRESLTEVVQTVGRLFRDVEGKTHVETYQILPFAFDQLDKESTRENLNGLLKAILLSMLLENVVNPARIPAQEKRQHGGGTRRINYLKEAFPDYSDQASVVSEIQAGVIEALGLANSEFDLEAFRGPFNQIVSAVLLAHGVSEQHEEIGEQVLLMFNRLTVRLDRLNVNAVGGDFISENPFECLLRFSSEICGVATFKELREATRSRGARSYDDAVSKVRPMGFSSVAEYHEWTDRPTDIPVNPDIAYRDHGWISWGEFLGTGRAKGRMKPYEEAQKVVCSYGFQTVADYRAWTMRPLDIPACPSDVYKGKGWVSWGEFLGTGRLRRGEGLKSYEDALRLVESLEFTSVREFLQWKERPSDIPSNPDVVYRNQGWVSWGEFLGTGRARCQWRPYEQGWAVARSLGLRTWDEYRKWKGRPKDIPSDSATLNWPTVMA